MTELKIQPVELCGAVGKCQASPQGYASSMPYGGTDPVRVAARALQSLEQARAADIEMHQRNLPAIEANKAVRAHVEEVMTAIGMPKRWTERDTKSRARYPKTIGHDAGYLTDLQREVRISDNFEHATRTYEELLKRYQAYAEQAAGEADRKRAEAERVRTAELEKRRADMALAAVLLRYGLPIESTWRDVLDALQNKHPRLPLAIAMQRTRMDWSEGPWRVRDALAGFQIECTEDKDIATCVLSGLDDFCDGRVFRDCAWSYDALFASIPDQQLVADVRQALSSCDA